MAILILSLMVAVVAVAVLAATGRRRARHELTVDQWHKACDALSSAAGSGLERHTTSSAVTEEPADGPTGAGHVRVLRRDPPGPDRMAAD